MVRLFVPEQIEKTHVFLAEQLENCNSRIFEAPAEVEGQVKEIASHCEKAAFKKGLMVCELVLANIREIRSDPLSRPKIKKLRRDFRRTGNHFGALACFRVEIRMHLRDRHILRAAKLLRQMQALAVKVGDRDYIASVQSLAGTISLVTGDLDVSMEWFNRSIGHWRVVGNSARYWRGVLRLAACHRMKGDFLKAQDYSLQAWGYLEKHLSSIYSLRLASIVIDSLNDSGLGDRARRMALNCLIEARKVGEERQATNVYGSLCRVAIKMNRPERARRYINRALAGATNHNGKLDAMFYQRSKESFAQTGQILEPKLSPLDSADEQKWIRYQLNQVRKVDDQVMEAEATRCEIVNQRMLAGHLKFIRDLPRKTEELAVANSNSSFLDGVCIATVRLDGLDKFEVKDGARLREEIVREIGQELSKLGPMTIVMSESENRVLIKLRKGSDLEPNAALKIAADALARISLISVINSLYEPFKVESHLETAYSSEIAA